MKKQILLLALILFGAVGFHSFNNSGLNACDKTSHAACFAVKKPAVQITISDYEGDEFGRVCSQLPFITL